MHTITTEVKIFLRCEKINYECKAKKVKEMCTAFPLLYLKDVLILLRQFHIVIVYAPVAQGIEHRPPEAGAAVRIRLGVYTNRR